MADLHPELESEQAHVDLAYQRLDESRDEAIRLKDMVEVGKGGTNQARWEREIFYENIANRLKQLDLGERSLCFGRIDQSEEAGGGSYHIGRIAVAGSEQEPLIVDWRAPVAESFYRATGRDPLPHSSRGAGGWSRDIRFALRVFRAHPVSTGVAVLSLGLGIGANTAIFSLLDNLLRAARRCAL